MNPNIIESQWKQVFILILKISMHFNTNIKNNHNSGYTLPIFQFILWTIHLQKCIYIFTIYSQGTLNTQPNQMSNLTREGSHEYIEH